MMQKIDICWNMFFIELSARSLEYDKIRSIVAEFDTPPPSPTPPLPHYIFNNVCNPTRSLKRVKHIPHCVGADAGRDYAIITNLCSDK